MQDKFKINGTTLVKVRNNGIQDGHVACPPRVTDIGDYAFTHCTNLTSITLPQGIARIGRSAFFCCINLTRITLPQGVAHIGRYAFSGCTKLECITIDSKDHDEVNRIRNLLPKDLQDKVVSIAMDINWVLNTKECFSRFELPAEVADIIMKQAISNGPGFFNKPKIQTNVNEEGSIWQRCVLF